MDGNGVKKCGDIKELGLLRRVLPLRRPCQQGISGLLHAVPGM